jgi:hypothetical protein
MRRIFPALLALLLLANPARLFAKGETSKITIQGADLKTPIQITDRKVLANIHVGSGPGTSSSQPGFDLNAPSFIVDSSQGPTAEPPQGLPHYEVLFYADVPDERLVYVVSYAFDAATGHGYVYLPGRKDKNYRLNVGTIFHGAEGKWFHAGSKWDSVARPLIVKATSYPHVISEPPSILNIIGDPAFPPADLPPTVPLHVRPDTGGHASFITPPHELDVSPSLDSRTVVLPPFAQNTVCYSIRSYRVTRDDPESDSTRVVGYSTCQPAVRFHVKDTGDSVQGRLP